MDADPFLTDIRSQHLAHAFNYESALRRRLNCYTRNFDDTEELLQETYVRLLTMENPEALRVRSILPFAITVATSIARDWLRSQKVVSISLGDDLGAVIRAESARPEEVVNLEQELAVILNIMDSMPKHRREVFLLRKLDDLTQEQIANILGISETAVERHLVNAARDVLRLFSHRYEPSQGMTPNMMAALVKRTTDLIRSCIFKSDSGQAQQ